MSPRPPCCVFTCSRAASSACCCRWYSVPPTGPPGLHASQRTAQPAILCLSLGCAPQRGPQPTVCRTFVNPRSRVNGYGHTASRVKGSRALNGQDARDLGAADRVFHLNGRGMRWRLTTWIASLSAKAVVPRQVADTAHGRAADGGVVAMMWHLRHWRQRRAGGHPEPS